MPDLLDTASEWLEGKRAAYLARTVTYQRGSDSVDLSATIGRSTFEVERGFGATRVSFATRDYLIAAADLVINGVGTTPQAGDRIVETYGSKLYTCEVVAPQGEDVFRWSDPYRRVFRVHTKLVAEATVP